MEITNKFIASTFRELAKLMEFHGENKFKIRSYQNAYQTIRKYPEQLAGKSKEELLTISGIGQAIAEKIITISEQHQLPLLEKYRDQTPLGIIELLGIRGLGPKKVRLLYDELSIESPGELYYACKENRLVKIKGMGPKTQQKLLDQLDFYLSNRGRIRLDQALDAWSDFAEAMNNNNIKVQLTGDLRRKMPVIHTIEFLLSHEHQAQFEKWVQETEQADKLEKEEGKVSFYFNGLKYSAILSYTEDWDQDLLRTTSGRAFEASEIAAQSEQSFFEQKNWPYIPPELRDMEQLDAWLNTYTPEDLISDADIKGLVHAHTDWSDGGLSLEQLVNEVRERGYEYLTITDHSKAAFYANGLDEKRLKQQASLIDQLNEQYDDFRILKGCEVDILNDGRMDLDPSTLESLDIVIASIHSNLSMPLEKAMDRLLTAIANPHVHMLGHPTGRLILARNGYEVDHRALIDACAEHNVAIEINANPLRLDIDWTYIPYCMEKGVKLSINPDAHSLQDLDYVKYGVMMGRKGGLTKDFCLNSLSANEFLESFKR